MITKIFHQIVFSFKLKEQEAVLQKSIRWLVERKNEKFLRLKFLLHCDHNLGLQDILLQRYL